MAAKRRNDSKLEDDPEGRPSPKVPKPLAEKHKSSKRLIVVLERSSLETVKAGKQFELMRSDKHKSLLEKHGKDPASARPDITHQCLLMLLDSPLNRAGLLQVYIHTERNVLIEVNPSTRIPRTFDRFCGLMVQLLHKLSIRAVDGPQKLLKVVKNPVTLHLPTGCHKVGTSFSSDKLVDMEDYALDEPVVVVIGAMAHGKVEVDYTEEEVAISEYPLSAALTCAKVCCAFEKAWGIK